MNRIRLYSRPLLPLTLGFVGLLALLAALRPAWAVSVPTPSVPDAAAALSREAEPLIVEGADLPTLVGAALEEIGAFAYDGSGWSPIPFQIDERNITGTIVSDEDGVFDGNDLLVFMAADAGVNAPTSAWASANRTRLYDRYALHVVDPLNADEGWVYVYRGANLPISGASYVAWDPDTQTVSGVNYDASFSQGEFVGLADLSLNGSADILDRQKFWAAGTLASEPFSFTEELSGTGLGTGLTSTIALATLGAVRATAGNNTVGAGFAFYGERVEASLALDLSDALVQLDPGIFAELRFESVRTSADFLSPTLSGMAPMTYYDGNTLVGVPVDGVDDAVPTTPMPDWYQVSGAAGSLVSLLDVDPGQGVLSFYYRDDGALDPEDTGDGRHYGDVGYVIQRAGVGTDIGLVSLAQKYIFLDPAQPLVGDVIADQNASPLQVSATAETHPDLRRQFLPYLGTP